MTTTTRETALTRRPRVRRPGDALRSVFALILILLILLTAVVAASTAKGIDQDIVNASTNAPKLVILAVQIVGVIGTIVLPLALASQMMWRGRRRQLVDALAASSIGLIVAVLLSYLVTSTHSKQLLLALTGTTTGVRTQPVNVLLVGIVAFATVARAVESPRWAVFTIAAVLGVAWASLIGGGTTAVAQLLSILLGWGIGTTTRYVSGTEPAGPSTDQVQRALIDAGFPVLALTAGPSLAEGQRYRATLMGDNDLDVLVFDRDREAAGVVAAVWRTIRVRDGGEFGGFGLRRRVDRGVLMTYALTNIGLSTPAVRAVREVGSDAILVARDTTAAVPLDHLPGGLSDTDLDRVWHMVQRLHVNDIALRPAVAAAFGKTPDGQLTVLRADNGQVAANEVALLLDEAELLASTAALVGPQRAVDAASRAIGSERLARLLPGLQPVALGLEVRRALKGQPTILPALREIITDAATQTGPIEQIQLERLKPRVLIGWLLGALAVYLLLSRFATVNISTLVKNATWSWVLAALVASAVTYVGATMTYQSFALHPLKWWRTFQAQLASSFASLVSPPTIGGVAINVRYMQRSGLHSGRAGATVAVAQVSALATHLVLLAIAAIAAGTQANLAFRPPRAAFIAVAVVVLISAALFALAPARRWLWSKAKPIAEQAVPQLLNVLQRPLVLLQGFGGILILNLFYCVALAACVKAFGGTLPFAVICFVYLAGSTLGSAAPTPGGLGAVEAALVAGLYAAGLHYDLAVSATLLFRALTFWLPVLPGWLSFRSLQRADLM